MNTEINSDRYQQQQYWASVEHEYIPEGAGSTQHDRTDQQLPWYKLKQSQASAQYMQLEQQLYGTEVEELFSHVRKNPNMIRELHKLVRQHQQGTDGAAYNGQQSHATNHYHGQQQGTHLPMSPGVPRTEIQQQAPSPQATVRQQRLTDRNIPASSQENLHAIQQKLSRLNDSADNAEQDGWQQVGSKKARANRLMNQTQGNENGTSNQHDIQHQQHHLSLDQLKRAVANNLPCFIIDIDKSIPVSNLPSAIIAADLLYKALLAQGVCIRPFSLVAYASSHRLKLGVVGKEDFTRLIELETWPDNIDGKQIKVLKPKTMPDAFSLVVRFVPRNLSSEFVINEIKRLIGTAVDIKTIRYSYDRPTDDYRFIVTDVREHQMALGQKWILIGNRMHPLTPFLPGNKLTFCTKCWKLGHVRSECQTQQRCKWCLVEFVQNEGHQCSNRLHCAQCDGDHHSLDSRCLMVKNYKSQLKQQVEDAIRTGVLSRPPPPLWHAVQQQQPLNLNSNDFPQLQKPSTSAWQMKDQQLQTHHKST